MANYQDKRIDFKLTMESTMGMNEADNYKQILNDLGFSKDIEYNVRVLNGVGAYITNVDKNFDLNNITEGSLIYECIKTGGQITIDKPLPLKNGISVSSQVGVYCTNYQDVYPKVFPMEKESGKTR